MWHPGADPEHVYPPGEIVNYLPGIKDTISPPFAEITLYFLLSFYQAHYHPTTSTLTLTAKQWEPELP